MGDKLLSTILELARLGAVGIAAIIALLAYLMLRRSQEVDERRAKLIGRYMTFGFVFAAAAGVLGLVPLFVQPGGPVALRLAFSPDMNDEGLPIPVTVLPDGKRVSAEETFSLPASLTPQVLTVRVDKTLKEVRQLRDAKQNLEDTTKDLAVSAAAATEQVKTLSAKATETTPVPEAEQTVQETTALTQKLNAEMLKSIDSGDYARANSLSTRLRTSVLKTDPAVTEIARNR